MDAGSHAQFEREACDLIVAACLHDGHEVVLAENGVDAHRLHRRHVDLTLGAQQVIGVLKRPLLTLRCQGEEENVRGHDMPPIQ